MQAEGKQNQIEQAWGLRWLQYSTLILLPVYSLLILASPDLSFNVVHTSTRDK